MDVTALLELTRDGRTHNAVGVVIAADDSGSHFEVDGADVMVEVELQPSQVGVTCRLGAPAGGQGAGLWRVPAIGTEVLVVVPDGELDFMPTIVCCASSGGTPDRVGDDRTILVAPDRIEVIAPDVRLGEGEATQEVLRGTLFRASTSGPIAAAATTMAGASAALGTAIGILPTVPGPAMLTFLSALATYLAAVTSSMNSVQVSPTVKVP